MPLSLKNDNFIPYISGSRRQENTDISSGISMAPRTRTLDEEWEEDGEDADDGSAEEEAADEEDSSAEEYEFIPIETNALTTVDLNRGTKRKGDSDTEVFAATSSNSSPIILDDEDDENNVTEEKGVHEDVAAATPMVKRPKSNAVTINATQGAGVDATYRGAANFTDIYDAVTKGQTAQRRESPVRSESPLSVNIINNVITSRKEPAPIRFSSLASGATSSSSIISSSTSSSLILNISSAASPVPSLSKFPPYVPHNNKGTFTFVNSKVSRLALGATSLTAVNPGAAPPRPSSAGGIKLIAVNPTMGNAAQPHSVKILGTVPARAIQPRPPFPAASKRIIHPVSHAIPASIITKGATTISAATPLTTATSLSTTAPTKMSDAVKDLSEEMEVEMKPMVLDDQCQLPRVPPENPPSIPGINVTKPARTFTRKVNLDRWHERTGGGEAINATTTNISAAHPSTAPKAGETDASWNDAMTIDVVGTQSTEVSPNSDPQLEEQSKRAEANRRRSLTRKTLFYDPLGIQLKCPTMSSLCQSYHSLDPGKKGLFKRVNCNAKYALESRKQNTDRPHCLPCCLEFTSWTHLEEHVAADHYDKPLYRCLVCEEFFATSLAVICHLNLHPKHEIDRTSSYHVGLWSQMKLNRAKEARSKSQSWLTWKETFVTSRTDYYTAKVFLWANFNGVVERRWQKIQIQGNSQYETGINYLVNDCQCEKCFLVEKEGKSLLVPTDDPPSVAASANEVRSEKMLHLQSKIRKLRMESKNKSTPPTNSSAIATTATSATPLSTMATTSITPNIVAIQSMAPTLAGSQLSLVTSAQTVSNGSVRLLPNATVNSTSSSPPAIKCNLCGEGFATIQSLQCHTVQRHPLGVQSGSLDVNGREFDLNCHSNHLAHFMQLHESLVRRSAPAGEPVDHRVPPERLWAVVKLMNGQKSSVEELSTSEEKSTMSFYQSYDEMVRLMAISLGVGEAELRRELADQERVKINKNHDSLVANNGPNTACPLCDQDLPVSDVVFSASFLANHCAVHHPREYLELYRCLKCDWWFRRAADCEKHAYTRHGQACFAVGMQRMKDRTFNVRMDQDEEEEEGTEREPNRGRWFSAKTEDDPPMIVYNCKMCLTTMAEPIDIHYHLIRDHGVDMTMLRNFYLVIDRTVPNFDLGAYEKNRWEAPNKNIDSSARLWFLCYLCGAIMGQEVDLKAHLVGKHGAVPPIHTLVAHDHMVFRAMNGTEMDLGGAIADSTKTRMMMSAEAAMVPGKKRRNRRRGEKAGSGEKDTSSEVVTLDDEDDVVEVTTSTSPAETSIDHSSTYVPPSQPAVTTSAIVQPITSTSAPTAVASICMPTPSDATLSTMFLTAPSCSTSFSADTAITSSELPSPTEATEAPPSSATMDEAICSMVSVVGATSEATEKEDDGSDASAMAAAACDSICAETNVIGARAEANDTVVDMEGTPITQENDTYEADDKESEMPEGTNATKSKDIVTPQNEADESVKDIPPQGGFTEKDANENAGKDYHPVTPRTENDSTSQPDDNETLTANAVAALAADHDALTSSNTENDRKIGQ